MFQRPVNGWPAQARCRCDLGDGLGFSFHCPDHAHLSVGDLNPAPCLRSAPALAFGHGHLLSCPDPLAPDFGHEVGRIKWERVRSLSTVIAQIPLLAKSKQVARLSPVVGSNVGVDGRGRNVAVAGGIAYLRQVPAASQGMRDEAVAAMVNGERLEPVEAQHLAARQFLVSDGFETKIGRADRAKPVQTKKFAIHTLGHVPTFATPLRSVWNVPLSRPSLPCLCCA